MRKTIAFIRVSTNNQDLISQKSAIIDYCKQHKIVIDEWIEEKISGYKVPIEQRKNLTYIKDLALNGELDTLVIFNSDRIIRDTSGSMYLKSLALNGVKILSVTEGELYSSSEIDELIGFIKFFNSNQESKKTSNRVKAGKKVAFEKGKWQTKAPYGYKLVNGILEIEPSEANVIKELFNIYNSYGMKACLQWLDDNDISKRNHKWTNNSVWQLLNNSIYYGQPRSKKHDIPFNKDLAIIDKETFDYTQQLLKQRKTIGITKHTNKSDALLEGLLYHIVDDEEHKLYVDYSYNGKYKHLVYRCSTCKFNRNRPKGIRYNFSGNKYHKIVTSEIERVLSELSIEQLESEYNKHKALELTTIESNISNLTNTLELKHKALQGANNTLESIFNGTLELDIHIVSDKIKSIQNDIIELEKNIKKLNEQLQEKESENVNKNRLIDKYKDFNYLWNIATMENKKAIINELVDKVVIGEDNDIEIKVNI